MKTRLEESIRAKADEHGRRIMALEVMPGQVHLFVEFVEPHPKHSPSYVADPCKGFTSHHLRAESAHPRLQSPTLGSRSSFVATVGAGSAETVRRSIDTHDERVPKGGDRAQVV